MIIAECIKKAYRSAENIVKANGSVMTVTPNKSNSIPDLAKRLVKQKPNGNEENGKKRMADLGEATRERCRLKFTEYSNVPVAECLKCTEKMRCGKQRMEKDL